MKGSVLFTNNIDFEIKKIALISKDSNRKFYIYGNCPFLDNIKHSLPDFIIINLRDILEPQFIEIFINNSESDFFVIKCLRFNDIMHRGVEKLQSLLGYKLVIDNHPFMGKSEVYWSYFLWSFFDRSLLGYPHCYSFLTALKNNSYNIRDVASKVISKTDTDINEIFKKNKIEVKRVLVDKKAEDDYRELKSKLFEEENSHLIIAQKLKRFINQRYPELKNGFDILRLGRVFDQYLKGIRTLIVSNLKVDRYLEDRFWEYINNVNIFMRTIYEGKIESNLHV